MRRALAVLGAVAMVAAAVLVRQALDDDGDGDGGSRAGGGGGDVVICARDLAELCDALGAAVRVEPAATTAAALASGELPDDVGAWVTTSAWLEVVESRATQALGRAELVARSRVVAAIDPERAAAVGNLCADSLWKCLGDNAGRPWEALGGDRRWGDLRTGLPSADTAVGLAVLGAVVSGYFGSQDFAANDFEAAGLGSWLAALAAPSRGGEADPAGTLVTRRGAYTAAAAPAADAVRLGDRVAVLDAAPAVPVEVVVVRVGGGDPPAVDAGRDALVGAGWEPATGPAPARYKRGVLAALHTLWTEVT